MTGVLTPGGYVSQNQFFSEQFTQFVSRAKNQEVGDWLAPPFLEHGKTEQLGRHQSATSHVNASWRVLKAGSSRPEKPLICSWNSLGKLLAPIHADFLM